MTIHLNIFLAATRMTNEKSLFALSHFTFVDDVYVLLLLMLSYLCHFSCSLHLSEYNIWHSSTAT